jgi:hypothetical protein
VSLGINNAGSVRNEDIIGKGRDAVMPVLTMLLAGVVAESYEGAVDHSGKADFDAAWHFARMAFSEMIVDGTHVTFAEVEQRDKEPIMRQAIEDARDEAIVLIEENINAVRLIADLLAKKLGRQS